MTYPSQDKVDRFFAAFPLRKYPKGQILIFANEDPPHIYYVVSGRIRMYDISYRGDIIIVNIFQPPAIFPLSWALNHVRNGFFYAAETPIEVHIAPPEEVVRFLTANPDVMFDTLKRMLSGTEGFMGRMVHLMSGTAKSRLVFELVTEAKRFGEHIAVGSYLLNLSEADLAARTGMSRETVSREFSKLSKESLVEVRRVGIIIHDLEALENMLDTAS